MKKLLFSLMFLPFLFSCGTDETNPFNPPETVYKFQVTALYTQTSFTYSLKVGDSEEAATVQSTPWTFTKLGYKNDIAQITVDNTIHELQIQIFRDGLRIADYVGNAPITVTGN